MYLQNAQAMKKKDTKGSNSFKKNPDNPNSFLNVKNIFIGLVYGV
jgi:hypothetical protein